jgi:uncharacterized protein (DUF58 family)
MIAPTNRLILFTAAVALPLALLAALRLAPGPLAAVLGAAFALLALADAAGSLGRLDGVGARFPEVGRLTLERPGELFIEIDNGAGLNRLRVALALPRELASEHEVMAAALPAEGPRSLLPWPLTGRKRGRYLLDGIHLETDSRLGLWAVRRRVAAAGEVRVYPSTLRERRNLAALFLNRGLLGVHAQRQVGKGKEFEKLRDYVPGDAFEDVHWKATAKRGRPATKVFQIERTQELYVVIDASRLSARRVPASGDDNAAELDQLERFITAAMVLGLVAEHQGDRFGLVAFHDQVARFVRAKNGKAHYRACRDALYLLEPKLVNPDYAELAAFLRTRLRHRALLIFLTNLDDPILAENFLANIDLIARQHLILVNMISPPGVAPFFSSPGLTEPDQLYRALGGQIQWQKLIELGRGLSRRGVAMRMIDDEKLCPQLVGQYINVKRRQVL